MKIFEFFTPLPVSSFPLLPVPWIHLIVFSLRFNDTYCSLEWYSGILRRRWHISCTDMSLSEMLVNNSFWIEVSGFSSGLLLFSIWLNISVNAIDFGSTLLAYLDIYCKAACMLRMGLISTFALQLYNCIWLCRFMYGSFHDVTNSGCSYLSSRMNERSLIFFGYLNLHISWLLLLRIQYDGLHLVCLCSLFISLI